jgi:hypothetical protein
MRRLRILCEIEKVQRGMASLSQPASRLAMTATMNAENHHSGVFRFWMIFSTACDAIV